MMASVPMPTAGRHSLSRIAAWASLGILVAFLVAACDANAPSARPASAPPAGLGSASPRTPAATSPRATVATTPRPGPTLRPSPTPFSRVAAGNVPSDASSTNWAGYITANHGHAFSHTEATWKQPAIHCPRTGFSAVSIWIGLSDRHGVRAIEQIGTTAVCRSGHAEYYAWYELVPRQRASVPLDLRVAATNVITARIDRSGDRYTMVIGNGRDRSRVVKTYAIGETAGVEWIVEAPCSPSGDSCPIDSLARFDTVTLRRTLATSQGHSGSIDEPIWTTERITMRSKTGVLKARPSTLADDGSRFSVVWRHR